MTEIVHLVYPEEQTRDSPHAYGPPKGKVTESARAKKGFELLVSSQLRANEPNVGRT